MAALMKIEVGDPPTTPKISPATAEIIRIVEGIKAELRCGICCSTITVPVVTTCNHLFCKTCFTECLKRIKVLICPICKQRLQRRNCVECDSYTTIVRHYLQLAKAFQRDLNPLELKKEQKFLESQAVPSGSGAASSPLRTFGQTQQANFAVPQLPMRRKRSANSSGSSRAVKAIKLDVIVEDEDSFDGQGSSNVAQAANVPERSNFPVPDSREDSISPEIGFDGLQVEIAVEPEKRPSVTKATSLSETSTGPQFVPSISRSKSNEPMPNNMDYEADTMPYINGVPSPEAIVSTVTLPVTRVCSTGLPTVPLVPYTQSTTSTRSSTSTDIVRETQPIVEDRGAQTEKKETTSIEQQTVQMTLLDEIREGRKNTDESDLTVLFRIRPELQAVLGQNRDSLRLLLFPSDDDKEESTSNQQAEDVMRTTTPTTTRTNQGLDEVRDAEEQKDVEEEVPASEDDDEDTGSVKAERGQETQVIEISPEGNKENFRTPLRVRMTMDEEKKEPLHDDVVEATPTKDNEGCNSEGSGPLGMADTVQETVGVFVPDVHPARKTSTRTKQPVEEEEEIVPETVPMEEEKEERKETTESDSFNDSVVFESNSQPKGTSQTKIVPNWSKATVLPADKKMVVTVAATTSRQSEELVAEFRSRFAGNQQMEYVTKPEDGATHVVIMDESPGPSIPLAAAHAAKCVVVRREWIEESVRRGCLLDPAIFGVQSEHRGHAADWQRAKIELPLLQGFTFYVPANFADSKVLSRDRLSTLITSSGGAVVERPWQLPKNSVAFQAGSSVTDLHSMKAFTLFCPGSKESDAASRFEKDTKAPVFRADWIIDSLSTYTLIITNTDRYRVCGVRP